MPLPIIKQLAKENRVPERKVEQFFKKAKIIAAKEKHKEDYDYIVGIVRKMLGLNESELDSYLREEGVFTTLFRDFLTEMPMKIGDTTNLSSSIKLRNTVLDNADTSNQKKLFQDYTYNINKNVFYVFKDNKVVLYIVFTKNNKSMSVDVVENISNEKQLMFKVFTAILELKLFNEILTGDALSDKNISSHKKMIAQGGNLYLRNLKTGNDEIVEVDDIDNIMRRRNTNEIFVLKPSMVFECLKKMYKSDIDDFINHINHINEKEKEMNFKEYLNSLKAPVITEAKKENIKEEDGVECPECGEMNPKGSKKCSECGADLEDKIDEAQIVDKKQLEWFLGLVKKARDTDELFDDISLMIKLAKK